MDSAAKDRFEQLRELIGRDGPVNPDYVLEQAQAALDAGVAEAALLMAAAAGVGFTGPRDLDQALRWLARAAEMGEPFAQRQLRFLADVEQEASDWSALAAKVDLASWTAARPLQQVEQSPRIFTGAGFLDPRTCDWLIARAQPLQSEALVYGRTTGRPTRDDVRSNTLATFGLLELDLPIILVRERIANSIAEPAAHLERASVFRYEPGQRFTEHVDYLNPSHRLLPEIRTKGQRPITFLVYLNDGFEGGETHFTRIGRKLRGGVGEAVVFHNVDESGAPDQRSWHEGAPPTAGVKWLLSQFVRDKPQAPG